MYNTISLFSGSMGLDLGLENYGYTIRACIENDEWCCKTIRINKPHLTLVQKNIQNVTTQEILEMVAIKADEVFLVCGGPPCQPFSTAGKRKSVGDPRGNLFKDFVRFVENIRPPYFLMENVRGILSASIKHRPLNERGKDDVALSYDEMAGSALNVILGEFNRIGYTVNYKLINAACYGVPQKRERVLFLGSRDGKKILFPSPTHSNNSLSGLLPFVTLGDALQGLHDPSPCYQSYSEDRANIFAQVPAGGNWKALHKDIQHKALGGAYSSTGGRTGFYRRLSFDKPSPTILTSMTQKASGMCHPVENRPLSIFECKRLQQFPDDWQILGSVTEQYRQIGNAVPLGLAEMIGKAILQAERK